MVSYFLLKGIIVVIYYQLFMPLTELNILIFWEYLQTRPNRQVIDVNRVLVFHSTSIMKTLQLRYEKVSADDEGTRFRNRPKGRMYILLLELFLSLKVL